MMITLRRFKLQKLLIVLVLSGLLMSCGGSETSTPSSAAPSTTAPSTATPSYPLIVVSPARHAVDQSAKPFLLVGDAAWALFAALSDADAEFYLENRKQHGFTAVLANLLEKKYAPNAPANFYGFTPFTGKPFTTPREDYFAHVDTIVKLAAEKGIAVFIFPLFLGYQCGSDDGGWCGEVNTRPSRR